MDQFFSFFRTMEKFCFFGIVYKHDKALYSNFLPKLVIFVMLIFVLGTFIIVLYIAACCHAVMT